MEAISGRKSIQVSQWKRQLLDGASELFSRGKKSNDKEEGQAKKAELFQQIGRLQMELEWLKESLSCSDARELRKLVDHDHSGLSVSRQCAAGAAQVHALLPPHTASGIDTADHGQD
jgi:putative transposase